MSGETGAPDAARLPHIVADPSCELHQEWPTKPDPAARCELCWRRESGEKGGGAT